MNRRALWNRRIRGRMYGGVGGDASNGVPYLILRLVVIVD